MGDTGLNAADETAAAECVQTLVNVSEAFKALEQQAGRHGHRLPHFPSHAALPHAVRTMTRFPLLMSHNFDDNGSGSSEVATLLARAYPWASDTSMGAGGAEGQHQETARLLLRRLDLAADAADGGGGPGELATYQESATMYIGRSGTGKERAAVTK